MPPETRYARNGRRASPTPSRGRARSTSCSCPGSTSHVEQLWEEPGHGAATSSAWARFARVIIMDRRGVGLSDPLDGAA